MPQWVIGAGMNLIGSIAINLGTNVMKLGHNKRDALPGLSEDKPKVIKFREFQIGLTVFIIGNIFNFASFGFAAQSLLAALGSIQFVSNVIFAAFVLKEKITKAVLIATGCILLGCMLLVIFGNHSSEAYTADDLLAFYGGPVYIAYLIFAGAAVVGTYLLYLRGTKILKESAGFGESTHKWMQILPVAYSIFSAIVGTQSVLFSKSLSVLLRSTLGEGENQLGNWYTWFTLFCFILTAGFWMTRLNKGLGMFPAMIIVPVLQICWTLFSLISGMCYFKEYQGFTALTTCMFTIGVLTVFFGVYLLTTGGGGRAAEDQLKSQRAREEEMAVAMLRDQGHATDALTQHEDQASLLPSEGLGSTPDEAVRTRHGLEFKPLIGNFIDKARVIGSRVTSDFSIDFDPTKNSLGLGNSQLVATSPFNMPAFNPAHAAGSNMTHPGARLLGGHEESSSHTSLPAAPSQDIEAAMADDNPFGLATIKETPSRAPSKETTLSEAGTPHDQKDGDSRKSRS
eukprot:gene30364-35369_t